MRKLRKALATFLSFLMCFSLFANVAHAEEPVFIDSSNDAIVSDEDIVSEDEYSEDIDVISDENVDDLDIEEIAEEASELSEDDALSEDDLETIETSEDNNIAENINSAISEDIIDEALYEEVISENDIDIIEEPETPEPTEIETIIVEQEPIVYEDNVLMSVLDDAIEINETNFPDPIFRQYVIDNFDNNVIDGFLDEEEIENATIINLNYSNIQSLSGIEFLVDLEKLYCTSNEISNLDLSLNTNLIELCCDYNNLETLDICNNSKLIWLNCNYNENIEVLNVSNNTNLQYLMCSQNQISSLDVSNNPLLVQFDCSSNSLSELNVDSNPLLEVFNCSNNNITSINVSNNPLLISFECSSNNIENLDLSNNNNLDLLRCSNNELSSLDLSNNHELTSIEFSNNSVASIDLSNNSKITALQCFSNSLSSIYINNLSELYYLDINSNELNELDLSNNPKLGYLNCSYNNINSLNISNNSKIEELRCMNNNIQSLNVDNLSNLKLLRCEYNNIDELDISNCEYLVNLLNSEQNIQNSVISYENYENYYGVLSVDITTDLNPPHPNISIIVSIDEEHFPDDNFREYIKSFDINNDNQFSNLEIGSASNLCINNENIYSLEGIEYFSNLQTLDCSGCNLSSLDVSNNIKLYSLICSSNNLTELNLSNNIELNYLNCTYNSLSSINLPQSDKITNIQCSNNNLSSIDVSYYTNIYYLECYNNNISELDISNCPALLSATSGMVNYQDGILYFTDENYTGYLYVDSSTKLIPDISSGNIVVSIDEEHFPDDTFRLYVSSFDFNNDDNFTESEISAINSIYVSNQNITSLTGIEYFENLEYLSCDNNNISTLDLSNNKKLIHVICSYNEITYLGLNNLISLEYLYCNDNLITSINLDSCVELKYLDCSCNQLNTIDLSNNAELTELYCWGNQISSLDLLLNTNLSHLDCCWNNLSELDVSANSKLVYLRCNNNNLTYLNVDNLLQLMNLDCSENEISELDIRNCRYLIIASNSSINFNNDKVFCDDNETDSHLCFDSNTILNPSISLGNIVVKIDEDHFPDEYFRTYVFSLDYNGDGYLSDVEINATTDITLWGYYYLCSLEGIEYFNKLTTLNITNSQISSLDLSHNIELEYLNCSWNQLTSLNVSSNSELRSIDCSNNDITSLEIGDSDVLYALYCDGNYMRVLNISNLPQILLAYNEGEKELNSSFTNYSYVKIIDDMASYNISFSVDNNTNVIVDDSLLSGGINVVELNSENFTDDNFRQYVTGYDLNFDGWLSDKEIDLIKNIQWNKSSFGNVISFKGIEFLTSLEELSICYLYDIDSLDLSNNLKLKHIECSNCSLSSINLCDDADYIYLDFSNSYINVLDVSKYINLEYLNVSGCPLDSLDLRYNVNLSFLDSSNTNIRLLDITSCGELISVLNDFNGNNGSEIYYGQNFNRLVIKTNTILVYPGCGMTEIVAEIDENTFPDYYFREYINAFDYDSDGKFSEAELRAVSSIDISNSYFWSSETNEYYGIRSTKGIEIFPELCRVNLYYDLLLNDIDLSSNTKLRYLTISYNNAINELDVSQITSLEHLDCSYCFKLNSLIIGSNSNLYYLNCINTDLNTIDITNCEIISELVPDNYVIWGNCFYGMYSRFYIDQDVTIIYPGGSIRICDIIITPSYEQAKEFVKFVYSNLLDREPTEEELSLYINGLMNYEKKGTDVPYEILTSEEFLNKNLTNAEYVSLLYLTFFGRTPDADGAAYWINNLENGENTREYTITGFANSMEFIYLCANYNIESGRLDLPNTKIITFTAGDGDLIGSGSMDSVTVNLGDSFTLPECGFTAPDGYEFKEWKIIFGTGSSGAYRHAGESIIINNKTEIIAVWQIKSNNKFNVLFSSGAGELIGSGSMVNARVNENADYTLPLCEFTAPVGYEFDKWEVTIGESSSIYKNAGDTVTITADTLVAAMWKPKTNIAYVVEHYKQDYDGEYNSEPEIDNLTGTTATTVTPNTKSYAGFASPDVESVVIKGDGSTKVAYYYTRKSYNLTWDYNGGTASGDYTIGSLKYETPIVAPSLTRTGYTFAGWDMDIPDTMPSNDITIKAIWNANTNITYVVKHYKQDLDGEYNSAPEVQNFTGTADATVKPAVNDYEGFKKPSVKTVTIKADGSLVVKYYYKRNSYTLTWDLKGGTSSGDYTTGSTKYESPITAPTPTRVGYTFNGWNVSVPSNMPASDITIEAKWKAKTDTVYKVEHYKQGLDGKYTAKPKVEKFAGKTGASVTPEVKKYTGFKSPEVKTVKIKADGSLVVKYYYTRNKYTLKWDYAGGTASGTFTSGKIMYGTKITAPKPTRKGYTFNGWSATVSKTMPAKNLTYKAKWKINSYTLTWNLNGGTASNKYTSGKIKYNTKITAPIPTKEGYVFDGWSVSVPSKMPAKNLKITAKWREKTQEELVTDFVKRFYSEVLQRSQADIDADAAGINSWVNKLVSGQEDGANVAYGFVYSAEFQNKKVSDEEYVLILYHAFFGRDPFDPNNYDAGGYNNWVQKLKNGTDRMDVLAGFINSAEFENLCKKYNIKRGKLVPSEKPAYRKAHNLP